jgi:nucleoside-diphosphate-sugar epimerase
MTCLSGQVLKTITGFWHQRKVLVTGGAGFIGSHLVQRLVRLGACVSVADSLVRGSVENLRESLDSIEFIQCNLTNQDNCHRVCSDVEVVFQLASRVGGIGYYVRRPGEVITQNISMDTLMLQAALACGVERYVYASSAHVYPQELQTSPDASMMKEDDALPAHPELSYGWAKLIGEKELEYVIAEGAPIKAAILRLIGVYGAKQDADLETGSAIPVLIRRAIEFPKRNPFVLLGTGEETRSYCYVDDVVDAILLAAEKLDNRHIVGPLNIGSEDRIKIEDLAKEIIAISGKSIDIMKDYSQRTTVWGQVLDCSRAQDLLDGWEPKVSLREGLRKTYAYMLEKFGSTWEP